MNKNKNPLKCDKMCTFGQAVQRQGQENGKEN